MRDLRQLAWSPRLCREVVNCSTKLRHLRRAERDRSSDTDGRSRGYQAEENEGYEYDREGCRELGAESNHSLNVRDWSRIIHILYSSHYYNHSMPLNN